MLIHGIIVHKIEKDTRVAGQPNPEALITSRDKELNNTSPIVIELVEYIYNAYKTGKTFGSFDTDIANHPVQKWISDYIDEPDNNPFIPLTSSIMPENVLNMVAARFELKEEEIQQIAQLS